MNISHDALRDPIVLTELKYEGGIFERHFVLLKEHVIKGRLVGAPSMDGFRMSLQLRRIGGISEKEHAADVDGKVAEILNNSDCVEVEGDSSAPSAGPPSLRSSSQGKRPAGCVCVLRTTYSTRTVLYPVYPSFPSLVLPLHC